MFVGEFVAGSPSVVHGHVMQLCAQHHWTLHSSACRFSAAGRGNFFSVWLWSSKRPGWPLVMNKFMAANTSNARRPTPKITSLSHLQRNHIQWFFCLKNHQSRSRCVSAKLKTFVQLAERFSWNQRDVSTWWAGWIATHDWLPIAWWAFHFCKDPWKF